MQGQVFLGGHARQRKFIVAARDRCDETVDRIRCIRTKRFKYIRNFYPDRPYTQLNRYKECQYPVLRLMRRLHAAGQLTPAQDRFMADKRPPEELYDLQSDPYEIHNLATSPEYKDTLQKMRKWLDAWMQETHDRGGEKEDPDIIAFYEQKMKVLYDERIRKYYQQEGMKWKE